MRKRCLELMFILVLIFLPLVSSINLNLEAKYKPGETLIASIEGNFLSTLSQDNIYFYSERLQIPLIFDLARIQEKYYLYALLPPIERNYTLIIKQAHYFENGQEHTEDIEKNFSVRGNITDFSVSPGFIIAKENFSLTIESKNQALNLEAKFLSESQKVNIAAGQKKKISFSIDKVKNFTLTNIEVSALDTKYLIPAAIIPPVQIPEFKENITEMEKFRFSKSEFNLTVNEDTEKFFSIYLINVGDKDMKNIKLSLSGEIKDITKLNKNEIENLKEAESEKIELTIKTDRTEIFKGKIKASSGNLSTEALLTINSFEKEAIITQENESCLSLNGVVCQENQECKGTKVSEAKEENCCIGECEEKKNYSGMIIGIILIIAILAFLFFLYKKSKAKKAGSEEILKKKQKEFETRMIGGEVKEKLTKS